MWICSQCRETSEEEFGACWNCLTPRGDVIFETDGAEPEPVPPPEMDAPVAAARCPRCDAPRMMEDLPLVGQERNSWARVPVEVEVVRDPHPLLPRGSVRAELCARVCAACGYTELHALGAAALWETWKMLHSAAQHPVAVPPPLPPPQTPEPILRDAAGQRKPPIQRQAPDDAHAQRSPIGAYCALRASASGSANADFLPRTGRVLSTHADPDGGAPWLLLKLERAVEGTMQLEGASRYQRVEADACMLRPVGAAPEDPRRWSAQLVEARWVQRGSWQEGGVVRREGVLPIFRAECDAVPKS